MTDQARGMMYLETLDGVLVADPQPCVYLPTGHGQLVLRDRVVFFVDERWVGFQKYRIIISLPPGLNVAEDDHSEPTITTGDTVEIDAGRGIIGWKHPQGRTH